MLAQSGLCTSSHLDIHNLTSFVFCVYQYQDTYSFGLEAMAFGLVWLGYAAQGLVNSFTRRSSLSLVGQVHICAIWLGISIVLTFFDGDRAELIIKS